jgi:hypothetical protein
MPVPVIAGASLKVTDSPAAVRYHKTLYRQPKPKQNPFAVDVWDWYMKFTISMPSRPNDPVYQPFTERAFDCPIIPWCSCTTWQFDHFPLTLLHKPGAPPTAECSTWRRSTTNNINIALPNATHMQIMARPNIRDDQFK